MVRATHRKYGVLALMALALVALAAPYGAQAQVLPPAAAAAASTDKKPAPVCTDFAGLAKKSEDTSKPGLLTNISNFVKDTITPASKSLFQAFTNSPNYKGAVNAAITLMIVIYGVGFLIGVVQPSFGQLLVRLIKVGIIYALISPSGWAFFSDYAVKLFNDGTDEIIGQVLAIGSGQNYIAGSSPFIYMDSLAKFVLSPEMIIAVLGATLASGPYGLMMGGMLGLATVGLLKLLITGLKTYAVSFIVRAVLLGLAPVFIVFLLFEKTKQLFTSWLNVLIALSLQPILFFTFISFFLVMMVSASQSMLGGRELCWTEYAGAAGTTNKFSGWRFTDVGGKSPTTDEWTWEGALSCKFKGKTVDGKPCPPFPINILDLLSFLILVYVAQRFADVVDNIANDIASTAVNLGVDARQAMQAEKNQPAGGGGAGGGNSANTSAGAVTQLPPGRR